MKRQAVVVGMCFVFAALSFSVSVAADTQSTEGGDGPDRLTGIAVEQVEGGSRVVLEGVTTDSHEVSTIPDQDIVVLKLAGVSAGDSEEASLAPLQVHDGLVESVSASSYTGDEAVATRVEISLAATAQPEVTLEPRGLVVVLRSSDSDSLAEGKTNSETEANESQAGSSSADPWALAESILRGDTQRPTESAKAGVVSAEAVPAASEAQGSTTENIQTESGDDLSDIKASPSRSETGSSGMEPKSAAASEFDSAEPNSETPVVQAPEEKTVAEPSAVPDSQQVRAIAMPEEDDMARMAATTLQDVQAVSMSGGVLVHLKADGLIGDASYMVLSDPARLVVDLVGVRNRVSKTNFVIDSPQVKRVRVGNHPEKIRVVFDAGSSAVDFDEPRMVSSQTGLYLSLGEGAELESAFSDLLIGKPLPAEAATPVALAAAQEEPNSPAPQSLTQTPTGVVESVPTNQVAERSTPAPEAVGPSSPPASATGVEPQSAEPEKIGVEASAASAPPMRFIKPTQELDASAAAESQPFEVFGLQFERTEGRDRVAILSDAMVDYSIFEPDAETVMIRIPNARFTGDSGERITPESGGPVSLITTFEQPELDGSEVRVVMRRAPGLEPMVTRRATVILVDFENTGQAASAPPAFLPDEPAFLSEEETYANRLEIEGRLPADSSGLPGDDVDPDTSPIAELESGVSRGVIDPTAFGAALGVAEKRATRKASAAPAKMPVARAAAKTPPAAVSIPAAVDVLSEGGLIQEKKYTGRRISLDFKDVLISDVLRLIAEVSDLNIIAGDEVKGSITIRLVDVPWDQALDVILLTKGLGFMRVGNVLRIAPTETLKAEEETRLQERRQKEKLEDLEVKLQPINYANVNDVKSLVSRLLSPRGTANVDVRTNTVIIKDISSVIDEAVALIRAIDTQTPQVMIEAKIVEANLDFARELGSTWSFGTQPYVDGFNPGAVRTDLGSENFKFAGENNVVVGNPITSVATGTVNFGAFLLDDKMQVDVHIQAMEQAGEGKVISSPRVVTLDNREASIEQGVSIPFQTFESGDAKLEFIDAVLSLTVTPHITRDESIIMSLEVTRNAPDQSVPTSTGSPAIAKNQAKTETLVKDGQTLVIGGIYTIDKTTRESRVPYLHKIPLIGRAFMSREVSDRRKELLIFVTPRIVLNPALASAK